MNPRRVRGSKCRVNLFPWYPEPHVTPALSPHFVAESEKTSRTELDHGPFLWHKLCGIHPAVSNIDE